MPLRRADRTKIRRFTDGEDWLELREVISKHDRDVVAEVQQNLRVDPRLWAGDPEADERVELRARIVEGNRTLFALLAVRWSREEAPTADAYDQLDEESGEWVDQCVKEILTARRERAEGNAPSASPPETSPSSSGPDASPPSTDSPTTSET